VLAFLCLPFLEGGVTWVPSILPLKRRGGGRGSLVAEHLVPVLFPLDAGGDAPFFILSGGVGMECGPMFGPLSSGVGGWSDLMLFLGSCLRATFVVAKCLFGSCRLVLKHPVSLSFCFPQRRGL
jgi:hypothetical protein